MDPKELNAETAKLDKAIKAARSDGKALERNCELIEKRLQKGEADEATVVKAYMAMLAYMDKHGAVGQAKAKPFFDELPRETQQGIVEIDGRINDALAWHLQLKDAKKLLPLDPERDADLRKLIKELNRLVKQARPPRGVAQLLKTIETGLKKGPADVQKPSYISVLPLAIILFMILTLWRKRSK